MGKNNGDHKARPRKIKRQSLEEIARLSLDGEVVRAADGVVTVCCPRKTREQSPFFAKEAQKITEYRDTAPLKTETVFLCITRFTYQMVAAAGGV